jgi:hypothetical protein
MPDRFWSKVAIGAPDACWLWQAGRLSNGYGAFRLDGRMRRAHQIAYELKIGPIPDGLIICHSCDVRACCNPDHLWAGTTKENLMDREAKSRGRRLHGSDNPRAVLTEPDVHWIRRAYRDGELDQRELAERFGITQSMVGMILRYERWEHLLTPDAPPYRADRQRVTDRFSRFAPLPVS